MIALKHLVAALLTLTFERVTAGPCRPFPISIISSSTFGIPLSSTLTMPESTASSGPLSDASTASHLYTEPTTNAAAISLSTSITLSFESTATASTTSTKSQDIIISTTSGTTADLTTEGSQSTTETTSNEKTTKETTTETATPTTKGSQGTTETTSNEKTTKETTTGTVTSTTEETTSTGYKTTTVSTTTGTTSEVITTSTGAATTSAAESTSGPATSSIETTTTTAAAPVSTTFNLIMQGGRSDGVVLHSDGQSLQLRTPECAYPYPATYPEAALSYDQDTQHLLIGEKPLCVMYDSTGIIAGISVCRGVPTGQYAYLTCDLPSSGALACNIPGMKYDGPSASLIDLGQTWSHFYYLEVAKSNPGLGWIILGRAGLTSNDIKYQNFDPISIITRVA